MSGSSDVLIVHIGAGNHSKLRDSQYRKLLRKAIRQSSLVDAAGVVERSPLTNTGNGSSLNLKGKVECDASFIQNFNGNTRQGSLTGIDDSNVPIETTLKLYEKVQQYYAEKFVGYGLSTPSALVYSACRDMFGSEGSTDILILPEAQHIYDTYQQHMAQEVSDTIGIVEIGLEGTTLATSSGGNFFKIPGRVGCAGIIGAAIDFYRQGKVEISCMCTGSGEDIMAMKLAYYIVSHIYNETDEVDYGAKLVELVQEQAARITLTAVNQQGEPIIYLGAIVIINTGEKKMLVYCHSTESFYFGYKSNGKKDIVVSRLHNPAKAGKVFAYGEFLL